MDAGQVIVRITADIKELKEGLNQAKKELQEIKAQAESSGKTLGDMSGTLRGIHGTIMGAAGGLASFLGIALSVYGVLTMWKTAVEAWYSIMKAGVQAVDDYRMAVYAASGLMASISKVPEPEMGAAYNAWKEYFAWLFRESAAADRLVAASGREIFEAGMELAMRGLVPKTEQQVYVTGLLVDMIKSVTKGLSEKQQLWQEIRSMFEGQVRLGAQALQKFTQIDPDFVANFAKAREEMMRLGDAQPVWDLLQKTLQGMTYSSGDMQMTFNSLFNTATTGFQILMMEAFGPAYEKIVELGWELLSVFYIQGRLTEAGQKLASVLSQAFEGVRAKIEEWVQAIQDNPALIIDLAEKIVTGLTEAASAAISVAKALIEIANAIKQIDVGQLAAIAAILIGIRVAMVNPVGGAIMAAGGMAYLGLDKLAKDAQAAETALNALETDLEKVAEKSEEAAEKLDNLREARQALAQAEYEATTTPTMADTLGQASPEYKANLDKAAIEAKETAATVKREADYLEKESNIFAEKFIDAAKTGANGIISATSLYTQAMAYAGNNVLQQQIISLGMFKAQQKGFGLAPTTPDVKPQMPKAKGGGGKERESRELELIKQYNDLVIKEQLKMWEGYYKTLHAMDETRRDTLKRDLTMQKIDQETYFNEMAKLNENSLQRDLQVMEQKRKAIEATTKLNLENIEQREAAGKIYPEEAAIMKDIERTKRTTELYMLELQIAQIKEKGAQNAVKLEIERYQWAKKIAELMQQYRWEAMGAWGDKISQRQVATEQLWDKFRKDTEGLATTDPRWQKMYDDAKIKESAIKYGEAVSELTKTIQGTIDSLVDGIMEGNVDLQKIGKNLFKGLLKTALKPAFEQLEKTLTDLFKSMFENMGTAAASALIGAIAIFGMMLMKQGGGSFSPSGVTSQVTGHEAVRGVIAGETSIPIAKIGESLQDALVETNGILRQIERNTKLFSGSLTLDVSLTNIDTAIKDALDSYFASAAITS